MWNRMTVSNIGKMMFTVKTVCEERTHLKEKNSEKTILRKTNL